jgi:hypothetical protein
MAVSVQTGSACMIHSRLNHRITIDPITAGAGGKYATSRIPKEKDAEPKNVGLMAK